MSVTQLLVQPGAGTAPLIEAIDRAHEIIQIAIFRFDCMDIEAALRRAARRGVFVHALVANTSVGQGGDVTLRKLEMRLLADGVSVARTAGDLARYHDKMMIVDRESLYILAFNYTHIDIDRSRSFGIVTSEPEVVAEAEALFIADSMRQKYSPACDAFVVSPENARSQLTGLIRSAKHKILIYDDKLSDPAAMRLLTIRAREGLDVRVLGLTGKRAAGVNSAEMFMRLHAQVIICDSERMFIGSQSLRTPELDNRREVGVLIDSPEIIRQVEMVFEADWLKANESRKSRSFIPAVPDAISDNGIDDIEFQFERSEPSAEVIKSAVKDAILDALLETCLPTDGGGSQPLKKVISSAAKEVLHELAL